MVYTVPVMIVKDPDGYFAQCPALQGCYAQGQSYEEALESIRDAVALHIRDRLAEGEDVPALEAVSVTALQVAA